MKFLLITAIILVLANLFIFINRDKGFEYKKFSSQKELYPIDFDKSYQFKWSGPNKVFSQVELDQGLTLLNQTLGIDTIQNEENKIISIAGWLYNSFYKQMGRPDDLMVRHPLQQYFYLSNHREKQLWCGNFQVMFGFFCTAMGLPNRYVEIAPVNNDLNNDGHEVNEVYLKSLKKWVMVDATRNLLLTKKENTYFSVADYFDYRLQKNTGALFFVNIDTSSVYPKFILQGKDMADKYFNEDHFLRYYYTMDLSKVYAPWQKIKRYFLINPWYEIYDPSRKHSNFLFRIKQFFLFGIIVIIFIFLYRGIRKTKKI